jgi:hypothetical protein
LVHPFEQVFEVVEPALPKICHLAGPIDQWRQRTQLCAVMRLAAFVAIAHETGLLQDYEVFGDGRLRDPGVSRQHSDSLLAFPAQALEDRPPRRIGKRSEEQVLSLGH